MARQPIRFVFGGIDARHTRQPGNPSTGKNFYIKNQELFTRGGSSLVNTDPTFASYINTLHSAGKVGVSTRILTEEGTNLWHSLNGGTTWAKLMDGTVTGSGFNSCRWQDYLILVSGTKMKAYDIAAGTLADLGGTPPNLEDVTTWKSYLFGWAPNYAHSDYLWMCGEDEGENISKDVWPATRFLNVGGSIGASVMKMVPCIDHALILTFKGYYRLLGTPPDLTNLELIYAGNINLYNGRLIAVAADIPIWLGLEGGYRRIYGYTGTAPLPISMPIEVYEILQSYTLTYARAVGIANQWWMFIPNTPTAGYTTALVFDTTEREWFIYEFPFVIRSACVYSDYMGREYIYCGLGTAISSKYIAKLDDSATDAGSVAITTSFTLGPHDIFDAEITARTLYLQGYPRNNFTLSIYPRMDNGSEGSAISMAFTTGQPVTQKAPLGTNYGYNLSLRVTTTDKINSLRKGSITFDEGVRS